MKLSPILSQLLNEYIDRHPKWAIMMQDPKASQRSLWICPYELLTHLGGKASAVPTAEGESLLITKTL